MVARAITGNISAEATTPNSNIVVEAMRGGGVTSTRFDRTQALAI